MKSNRLDLSKTQTYSVWNRHNLVRIDNLMNPQTDSIPHWTVPEFDELVERIVDARKNDKPVIFFMGAHVVKSGLSRYVIELMERGIITHVASNGAGSIHDFELAFLGGTSEHVPTAIEDGSFGMWEETGAWMNTAINEGYAKGYGYGESLALYIKDNPERFPHSQDCILYRAYEMGIPATYHISIGTDIIQQHPLADFSALGGSSGIDFSIFCKSVSELEGGVFLNLGSAVTGAEVFLKALSIGRNQGYKIESLTTANFDIIPLGDYRSNIKDDHFHYYYRPRKNVINRPTSLGGKGFYIQGNHKNTIPNLYDRVLKLQGKIKANDPIEILKPIPSPKSSVKAVIFDFDGTISTLRQGWEEIMEPLMIDMIAGETSPSEELIQEVKGYIDESTGIQTIFQMRWLVDQVKDKGLNPKVEGQWWYKDEYNKRLLEMVKARVDNLQKGRLNPEDYMIKGAKEFVQTLYNMGLTLYVASGTDHGDVVKEVHALGLSDYFTQIAGAPERRADCSKEEVIRLLMEDKGLRGEELLVIGDGKVEIALGVEAGAITLGTATDEIQRSGINPAKRRRLLGAGAHMIVGDFLCGVEIIELLF